MLLAIGGNDVVEEMKSMEMLTIGESSWDLNFEAPEYPFNTPYPFAVTINNIVFVHGSNEQEGSLISQSPNL